MYAYPGGQQAQLTQLQPGVLNAATVENKYNQDGRRASIVLGITQFIIGCACICCQSVSSILEAKTDRVLFTIEYICTGIWCGALFLVTGILGICASKKNTRGLIVAFMVFNIISSLAIWILLGFTAINLIRINRCQDGEFALWMWASGGLAFSCTDALYSIWEAMDDFMAALALAEFIVAVTSAAYCCKAVCSCCRSKASLNVQQPVSCVYLPTTTTQQPLLQQPQLHPEQLQMQQQHQLPATSKPYPVQAPQPEAAHYPVITDHTQAAGSSVAAAAP